MAIPDDMDFEGPRDTVEDFIWQIITGPDWEMPQSFAEETTMWRFAQDCLEMEGYVSVFEDPTYETDIPGMDYGWYGVRLNRTKEEIKVFARSVIEREYADPENHVDRDP